jgi:dolichol kinase
MRETWRQAVHLLIGSAIAVSIAVFPPEVTVPFYAAGLLAGSALTDAVERGLRVPLISPLLDLLEREDSGPGRGAFYFFVATLGCLALFGPFLAAIGVFALALLDSASTLAGRRFGRRRLYNGKSVEGFLAGAFVTAGALLFVLPPVTAVLAAIVAGVVELVSPVDDNLVIPPAVCLVLYLAG